MTSEPPHLARGGRSNTVPSSTATGKIGWWEHCEYGWSFGAWRFTLPHGPILAPFSEESPVTQVSLGVRR